VIDEPGNVFAIDYVFAVGEPEQVSLFTVNVPLVRLFDRDSIASVLDNVGALFNRFRGVTPSGIYSRRSFFERHSFSLTFGIG
jgi:hypothetical protein